jgi:hypothetical protein
LLGLKSYTLFFIFFYHFYQFLQSSFVTSLGHQVFGDVVNVSAPVVACLFAVGYVLGLEMAHWLFGPRHQPDDPGEDAVVLRSLK